MLVQILFFFAFNRAAEILDLGCAVSGLILPLQFHFLGTDFTASALHGCLSSAVASVAIHISSGGILVIRT